MKKRSVSSLFIVIAISSVFVSCNNKDAVATVSNVETSSVVETETSSVVEIESSSVSETETSSVVETETSSVTETESSTESSTEDAVSSENRYKDPVVPAKGSEGYIMPSESEEQSSVEQSSVEQPVVSVLDISIVPSTGTPSTPAVTPGVNPETGAVTDENGVITWGDPDTGEVWVATPKIKK